MAATGAIMMVGMTVGSAYTESEAQKMQGDYQKHQGDINAKLAEQQGQDAVDRANKEAAAVDRKTKAMVGAQRARGAAQGMDINAGSIAELNAETESIGAVETMNIKTNAWREAWGYRVAAQNERSQGDLAQQMGKSGANQTLLAGGMKAAAYGADAYGSSGSKKTSRTRDSNRGSSRRRDYGAD